MAYANIMVSVDLGADAEGRIKLAAHLADAFEGQTTGVAAQLPDHAAAMVFPIGASSIYSVVPRAMVVEGLDRARDLFRVAVGERSRVLWRSALEPSLDFLVCQARGADLIVVGRGSTDPMTGCLPPLDPASVVLAAGRPVLVVPPGIDHLEGRRVVVAWKDGREARRAILDALPILRLASRVEVVAVTQGDGDSGVADVAAYLGSHGIPATFTELTSEGETDAETLLDLASVGSTDLIVMGAYGHGRLRETVLGGVTRDILRHCPICSFLSH